MGSYVTGRPALNGSKASGRVSPSGLEWWVAIVGRSHQNIHFFRWSFRRSGCETTSSAFVYFCAMVPIVHENSSAGQATSYKSIAMVKGDVSVNWNL